MIGISPRSPLGPSSKETWVTNCLFNGSRFPICSPYHTSSVLLVLRILKQTCKLRTCCENSTQPRSHNVAFGPSCALCDWLWAHDLVGASGLLALGDLQGCCREPMCQGASLWGVHPGTVGTGDYNMYERVGGGNDVYWVNCRWPYPRSIMGSTLTSFKAVEGKVSHHCCLPSRHSRGPSLGRPLNKLNIVNVSGVGVTWVPIFAFWFSVLPLHVNHSAHH